MSSVDSPPVRVECSILLPAGAASAQELREGDQVLLELKEGGKVALRLAQVAPPPPVEEYSAERIAEFLLSNAVSEGDYQAAEAEVRRLGLDPESVPHYRHSVSK